MFRRANVLGGNDNDVLGISQILSIVQKSVRGALGEPFSVRQLFNSVCKTGCQTSSVKPQQHGLGFLPTTTPLSPDVQCQAVFSDSGSKLLRGVDELGSSRSQYEDLAADGGCCDVSSAVAWNTSLVSRLTTTLSDLITSHSHRLMGGLSAQ